MEPDSKPIPSFTTDDLLAELETMLAPEGEGVRTIEVAHALNVCRSTALIMLKALDKKGRIERIRKQIVKFDGCRTTITAYRLKAVEQEQEDNN